jgi:hypothetical protein
MKGSACWRISFSGRLTQSSQLFSRASVRPLFFMLTNTGCRKHQGPCLILSFAHTTYASSPSLPPSLPSSPSPSLSLADTGQNYEVTFKRHIPVSSWVRWEEQGGMQAAMAPPVRKTPPLSIARGTPPIVLNMPMQPMAPNMGGAISGSPIPSFVPDTSYNAIPHKHNPSMPFDQPPQTFAQRPPQVYACVLILLYVSSYYCICVFSYYYAILYVSAY